MSQKGFANIILILVIALIAATGFLGLSSTSDNSKKKAVGKVLSEKSEAEKQAEESQKQEAESQNESIKKDKEEQKESSGSKSSAQSSSSSQGGTKVEVEKEKDKLKIKTKNERTGFESETEVEDGKEKTKIKFEGIKIEYEREGDKVVAKFKDENGEELELEATEEAEILDELENEIEDDDIKIATGSGQTGFVQKGRRVRTNFPLSINPSTGELFVTTPSGVKAVAVLPSVAIENMIKAGVLTRVEEPGSTPSPTPGEGSGSAGATQGAQIAVLGASIELTEQNNQPVYRISGVKDEKLFGLLPVEVKLTTVVSASNGSLVDIQEGIFARILDLLSN